MNGLSYLSNSLRLFHEQLYTDYDTAQKPKAIQANPVDQVKDELRQRAVEFRTLALKIGLGTAAVFMVLNALTKAGTLSCVFTVGLPLIITHDVFHLSRNYEEQVVSQVKVVQGVDRLSLLKTITSAFKFVKSVTTPLETNTILTFVWGPLINRCTVLQKRAEEAEAARALRAAAALTSTRK